jgi:N-acetylneuraminic acid mutarotase
VAAEYGQAGFYSFRAHRSFVVRLSASEIIMTRQRLNLGLPLTLITLVACSESSTPTQPDDAMRPGAAVSAAAANTWTSRANTPYDQFIFGYDLGMAPNSAGQSVVYAFGGTSSDEGGTGKTVKAYNVPANTWTSKTSQVGVFLSNGVGKIGNKLYFSGGYTDNETPADMTNALWAYDYASDRMIRRADLPILSSEGVTGVINGKLYVLPGACDGNRYPLAGSCAEEATRRFYRYDPATNQWTSIRQAPHFHRRGAATVLDGKLYVAGGLNNSLLPVSDLDVYNPATNTWSTLAHLPLGGVASGSNLSGQFYVVVSNEAASGPRMYAYNRSTNQWKAKAAPAFAGSVTRVLLDGTYRLFTALAEKSALYTP